jgi:hypothetical protein
MVVELRSMKNPLEFEREPTKAAGGVKMIIEREFRFLVARSVSD